MFRFSARLLALVAGLMRLAAADLSFTDCSETTLRGLVEQGGTIRIFCSSVITLTQPLVISRDTALLAQGPFALSGADKTRLFVVNPGTSLVLSNIGLFNGRQTVTNLANGGIDDTAGGAIFNNGGTVHLNGVTLQSHSVVGYPGQAGPNGATGGPGESGGDAAGAAIYNRAGLVMLTNCVLAGNTVTAGAGGRGGDGVQGFLSNGGNGGAGGAGGGGAIYSEAGTLLVYNSTFTNNQAIGAQGGAGGAAFGSGIPGKVGRAGDGVGGAIATSAAYMVISGSTFVNNSARAANGLAGAVGSGSLQGSPGGHGGHSSGGAIYNRGVLLMTNCTFSANASLAGNGGSGGNGSPSGTFGTNGGPGGNGGNAGGGAIENTYQSTVINCTFSANRAVAGTPGGGGRRGTTAAQNGPGGHPGAILGGAIYNLANQFSLANTIIANSTGPNFAGSITDLGGNLSTDTSAFFTSGLSKVNLTPGLLALANNGGPTATIAITTNSPAYNAGVNTYCPPLDQRGTNRFGICDIGAFEIYTPPPPPGGTNTNSVVATNLVLSLGRNTTNFVLLWPSGFTNYVLESAVHSISNEWKVVTNQTVTSRGFQRLELPLSTNSNRFFRMRSGTNQPTSGGGGNDLPPLP